LDSGQERFLGAVGVWEEDSLLEFEDACSTG
jgi:hypothetical protein